MCLSQHGYQKLVKSLYLALEKDAIRIRHITLFSGIKRGLKIWALLTIMVLATSCAVNLYSVKDEKLMGKHYAKEVEKEMKILHITALEQYANHIGQKLAQNVGETPYSYSFKIIDEDEINAFAIPAGYIFVYRGLLENIDNEAQLAAVLAHEIGHVEARHSTERISAIQGTSFLTTLGAIILGAPALARPAIELAQILGFLKYSRVQEREADLKGVDYMTQAGYEPKAMVDFLKKLQEIHKRKPGLISRVFMSHPLTEERIKTLNRWIEDHVSMIEAKDRKLTGPKFAIMNELVTKE